VGQIIPNSFDKTDFGAKLISLKGTKDFGLILSVFKALKAFWSNISILEAPWSAYCTIAFWA
jgi:hypothetical protein